MLSSENVSDHEVVGEAGEGLARVGKARGSCGSRDIAARGSHCGMCRVEGHRGGCRVRVVVRSWLEASEVSGVRKRRAR